jgi:hypothetical protein
MSRRTKLHNLSSEKRQAILRDMIVAGTNHTGQSHYDFSETNEGFQTACQAANIPATPRQAKKYRNKKGLAYAETTK